MIKIVLLHSVCGSRYQYKSIVWSLPPCNKLIKSLKLADMWQKIMILKPRKVRNQLWQNFQLNKWFSFQRIQNPTLAICRTSAKYHLMLDGKQIKLFEISYSTLL